MVDEERRYQASSESIDERHPWDFIRRHLVGSHRVLDVGCGSGDLIRLLGRPDLVVDGIEPHPARAAVAAQVLRRVSCSVAGTEAERQLDPPYDRIVLADVVEHLVDPLPMIEWCVTMLAEGGEILALVPNSATWRFRRKIALGDWSYKDSGYFDRDHVRFYDTRTIRHLVAHLELQEREVWFAPATLPRPLRRASRTSVIATSRWPNLFASHTCIAWSKS